MNKILQVCFVAATHFAAIQPVYAAGPVGLGSLKIGMTKPEVEQLAESADVHPTGPLAPYEYKHSKPIAGRDRFTVMMQTPLTKTPLKTNLTFVAERLVSIYIDFEGSYVELDSINKQIADKYGPGIVNDSRKEEQCIYKSGANFKLTSGTVSTKWIQNASDSERIETSTDDLALDVCPINLRDPRIGPIKMKSLSFRVVNPSESRIQKNAF